MPCPRCDTYGWLPVPHAMRALRRAQGVTGRQLARRMRVSEGYVSDLERGARAWTRRLEVRYMDALNALSGAAKVV